MRRRLRVFFSSGRNDDLRLRWERVTYWPMMALAVATLPLVLIPELLDISERLEWWIVVVDIIIWTAFAVDLVVRTWLAEQRVRFLLDHPFEVLIVVLPFFRPLRILRFARVLRPLMAAGILAQVLRKRSASWALVAAAIAIAVATVFVGIVERNVEDGIQDWGTVIWWGLATITTVGYGDVVPVTTIGRIVGVFLMIVGIGVFGILTANVAAWFVEQGQEEDRQEIRSDIQELKDQSARQEQILAKLEVLQDEVRSLREELHQGRPQDRLEGAADFLADLAQTLDSLLGRRVR